MIVSNNIINEIPADNMIARINLAWVKDYKTAMKLLDEVQHYVYLDYPSGRTKPPVPKITLEEALELSHHEKVKYFAVSNIETAKQCKDIMKELYFVEFVPKIETEKGVNNLKAIINSGVETIMLDKEDLYTDVNCDSDKFNKLVAEARSHKDIKVLELQGVIFK